MGRKKITSLATALLAVDALSPEETITLFDYLRSKTATPRKVSTKKPAKPFVSVASKTVAGIPERLESGATA